MEASSVLSDSLRVKRKIKRLTYKQCKTNGQLETEKTRPKEFRERWANLEKEWEREREDELRREFYGDVWTSKAFHEKWIVKHLVKARGPVKSLYANTRYLIPTTCYSSFFYVQFSFSFY